MVGSVSFGRFSPGTKMRTIALLVSLCALSGVASAQTEQQCPPTPRTGDLLNCYNGTTPPRALSKPKASKGATAADQPAAIRGPIDKPVSKTPTDEKAPYVDMIAGENKNLDAKLKTLCRGC
jgi:hypothetical protein